MILAFRRRSPVQVLRRVADGSAPFTLGWCAQHLPLIDAAMELLEADDVEFARRCRLMRDQKGRAMLDELTGQLERLGAHIPDVANALEPSKPSARGPLIGGCTPSPEVSRWRLC